MSFLLPFTLKRFIAQFLMPIPLVIELFVLGWVLGRFTRFKRTGIVLKGLAGCLFLAFGYGVGETYLYWIERKYQPFQPSAEQVAALRGADIIVLAQTFAEKSDLPVRYRGSAGMQLRLLEGIRIAKLIPDSRVLVSMAGEASDNEKAEFLNGFSYLCDLPRSRFVMFTGAKDTSDEAKLSLGLVRTNALVLATSAAHMPRAMSIFRERGLHPIPSPCDYQCIHYEKEWTWTHLPLPSGGSFRRADNAVYEWLGALYERIRD